MSKGKHRGWLPRRTYIVNPRYQIQFAAVLVLLQINVGIMYLGILNHRFRDLAEGSGSLEILLAMDFWKESLPVMALGSLVASLIVSWIGIRYSNQIVGPIPRLTRAMRELAQGNTKQSLVFRPGDALEELAEEFNSMCASLDAGIPLGADAAQDSSSAPVMSEDREEEPVEV